MIEFVEFLINVVLVAILVLVTTTKAVLLRLIRWDQRIEKCVRDALTTTVGSTTLPIYVFRHEHDLRLQLSLFSRVLVLMVVLILAESLLWAALGHRQQKRWRVAAAASSVLGVAVLGAIVLAL